MCDFLFIQFSLHQSAGSTSTKNVGCASAHAFYLYWGKHKIQYEDYDNIQSGQVKGKYAI